MNTDEPKKPIFRISVEGVDPDKWEIVSITNNTENEEIVVRMLRRVIREVDIQKKW